MLNRVRYDWMDRGYVLQFFGQKEGPAWKAYLQFLEEELGIDREQELSGGGFVRSQGGWLKAGKMPTLRKELARKAVLEYGLSLAETARLLGVTANAVSYMLKLQ
jgi:hypothetical protein